MKPPERTNEHAPVTANGQHPATPEDIRRLLSSLAAVGGTYTQRRDLEQRYFRFHKMHGTRLRGKYRPS